MAKSSRRGGFTLTEVLVAMSLASFVLMGVMGVASSMVRFQVEAMKKGTVTGWTLTSITAMAKEIEDANVLAWPSPGSPDSDVVVGCANWSRLGDGADKRLDTASPVKVFYYCYDSVNLYIRRYADSGAPPAVVCPAGNPILPACNGAGSYAQNDVIATAVRRDAGNFIFRRADDVGGVWLRYVVGDPNPSTNVPIPQTIRVDMKVAMQKQYSNTGD